MMDPNETHFTSTLDEREFHSPINPAVSKDSLSSHLDCQQHNYRNELELRVIGMMRSGNHAVIQWIQQLHQGRSVVFLNNLLEHGDHNPFQVCAQIEVKGLPDTLSHDDLVTCSKDVLIYSYEDRKSIDDHGLDLLSSAVNDKFEMKREMYLGKSKKRMDVLIIRDPFNFFASRLMMLRKDPMGGLDTLSQIIENWKLLAERIILLHQTSSGHQIPILYNKFILDENYQRSLSCRLHGEFAPASLQTISGYGGGSSFSTTSQTLTMNDFIFKAHKLLHVKRWLQIKSYWKRLQRNQPSTFLTRWKLLAADHEYRRIFLDQEILLLSEQLFGEIPGTRRFVAEIRRG